MDVKLIFGPPGTGKTTYLLNILEQELGNGYKLSDIAYVSFTREGSYQGKDRARKIYTKATDEDFKYFRTLHSIAFAQLGLTKSMIIDKNYYKQFSDKVGMHFTGYYTEELKHNDDMYLFLYDLHRNNVSTLKKYLPVMDITKYNFVKLNFKNFKKYHKLLDYTDMIQLFVSNAKSIPVKIAIIDEAQDLTTLQWKMVWTAFKDCDRVYIAGDDDQAIYQWSGADVDYFLGLKGDVTILNHSYRLPRAILHLSKKITSMISNRANKPYNPTDKHGEVVVVNELKDIVPKIRESWLFLSRNHRFLNDIRTYLLDLGIPFREGTKESIKDLDLKLIAYYGYRQKGLQLPTADSHRLDDIIKKDRGLEFDWWDAFNWELEKIEHYRAFLARGFDIKEYRDNKGKALIRISTIHSTKGSEADNVVVLSDITRTVYLNLETNPDAEHRVFYVAVTRARKNLYIVNATSKYSYTFYERRTNELSRTEK